MPEPSVAGGESDSHPGLKLPGKGSPICPAGIVGLSRSTDRGSFMDPCEHASRCVETFLNSPDATPHAKAEVRRSLDIVAEAQRQFSVDEMAMSFNGGKDCLVMLYIVLATLKRPVKSIYIRLERSFKEVDDFVSDCASRYGIDIEVSTRPMKDALASYLEVHPSIKAIFVGIRRADPWADELQYIQRTDHGWPDFIRVHPVLEWEYNDVWNFLKVLNIPYCPLYDLGFTSLGATDSTAKNPSLHISGSTEYRPAYELEDPNLERVGRQKAKAGMNGTPIPEADSGKQPAASREH